MDMQLLMAGADREIEYMGCTASVIARDRGFTDLACLIDPNGNQVSLLLSVIPPA